jgi:hypothetical protein
MYNGYNVEFVKDRFGNPNSAIRFSDGYYQLPSSFYFKGDFTISLWLKINVLVPNSRILAFSRDNYNDAVSLILYQYSSNYPLKPQLTIGSSGYSSNLIPPFDLVRGQWMHLVCTLSGTTGSFYINGMLVDQSNDMYIPRNNSRTSNFIGKDGYYSYGNLWSDLDDLRIYDRALSQTEIYDLLSCSSAFNSTSSISNTTNKPSVTNQTSNFKYNI